MSPLVFKEGEFVFWFHSYDVLHENRASVHIGKGSQSDLDDAIKIVERNLDRLQEAWNAHKRKAE